MTLHVNNFYFVETLSHPFCGTTKHYLSATFDKILTNVTLCLAKWLKLNGYWCTKWANVQTSNGVVLENRKYTVCSIHNHVHYLRSRESAGIQLCFRYEWEEGLSEVALRSTLGGGSVSSAGSGYIDVDREGAEGLPAAETRNGGGRLTSLCAGNLRRGRKRDVLDGSCDLHCLVSSIKC